MKLILTKASDSLKGFEKELEKAGIDFFSFPCLEFIEPSDEYKALDQAIRKNHLYDWIFFLSKTAADSFFTRLLEIGGQFFNIAPHLKIAVIGDSTAAFVRNQVAFPVDFIPSKSTSEIMAEEFLGEFSIANFLPGSDKQKIMLIRAELEDKAFENTIKKSGQFDIDTVFAYKTKLPENSNIKELKQILSSQENNYISFASSQTVKNFKSLTKNLDLTSYKNLKLLSIGPRTTETIKKEFPHLDLEKYLLESEESSFKSLVDLLKREIFTC